jgi:3-dehydroquinate synthase
MQRLQVESRLARYQVVAEPGALGRLGDVLAAEGLAAPRSLVSDAVVAPLWAQAAAASCGASLLTIPAGETSKCWATVEDLLGRWLERGLHRGELVAAVGGGVVSDLVGFAAAVFLRGIAWVAAPTTLVGMVDAAIGGKTGINLERGKNLVGAFWPPRLVVIDPQALRTLPARELAAGGAEVVKTAWLGDRGLLPVIRDMAQPRFGALPVEGWQELVMRCATVKAGVVSADEREAGPRAALNLGHTLGHALEAATAYRRFLHGEAVAWGLLAAARLGRRRGLLSPAACEELSSAVRALGPLPGIADLAAEAVASHIGRDKKRDDGGVAWVLPSDGGVALGQRVTIDEALEVFTELQKAAS